MMVATMDGQLNHGVDGLSPCCRVFAVDGVEGDGCLGVSAGSAVLCDEDEEVEVGGPEQGVSLLHLTPPSLLIGH